MERLNKKKRNPTFNTVTYYTTTFVQLSQQIRQHAAALHSMCCFNDIGPVVETTKALRLLSQRAIKASGLTVDGDQRRVQVRGIVLLVDDGHGGPGIRHRCAGLYVSLRRIRGRPRVNW